jgi:hypothetical protein
MKTEAVQNAILDTKFCTQMKSARQGRRSRSILHEPAHQAPLTRRHINHGQKLSHHTGLCACIASFCGRSNTSTPTSKSRRIEMAKGLAHRLSGAQVSTLLKFCLVYHLLKAAWSLASPSNFLWQV